mmetsp:Transcript_28270/g.62072  ORF Transcript_28270/g.62072 Transcript_28270/m.62072 type:complete len:232 (+) Transcript_28270:705-1400(+)
MALEQHQHENTWVLKQGSELPAECCVSMLRHAHAPPSLLLLLARCCLCCSLGSILLRLLLLSLLLGHVVLAQTPQHTEQDALQAVGDELGAQTTQEEAGHAVLLHNHLDDLGVAHGGGGSLAGSLDDADGVGADVRHEGRAPADEGGAQQTLLQLVILRQGLVQGVVHGEPGVVAHEGGHRGSQGTVVQHSGAACLDLVGQGSHTILALHLHDGLDCVHGHEEDTEEACTQ